MSYGYLLDLALILLSTKALSILTKRFNLPQVVGALLAGVIMGPACFNILQETEFISQVAEVGVIVLMFTAGIESNLSDLKKCGKASFVIALLGVIFPLIGGSITACFFNNGEIKNINTVIQNIFIGTILTATSVSITVETLKELGKLSTNSGNAILGAAIIDDVLGILGLTIVTSMADPSISISICIIKIIGFFLFSIALGYVIHVLFNKWTQKYNVDKRRFVIGAFVICLLMAFISEDFFQVADITGAFIAGLVLSENKESSYIKSRFETTSYMILSPMFFASIGISIKLNEMNSQLLILTIILTLIAIVTKILGCGLGAKLCGYTNKETLQIGIGMISRGEVALIIASKGLDLNLMNQYFLGPVVVMVIITTIITPILLKFSFKIEGRNSTKKKYI